MEFSVLYLEVNLDVGKSKFTKQDWFLEGVVAKLEDVLNVMKGQIVHGLLDVEI